MLSASINGSSIRAGLTLGLLSLDLVSLRVCLAAVCLCLFGRTLLSSKLNHHMIDSWLP